MQRLIPLFINEQFERNKLSGEFPAATMFMDIAGFTIMTQSLMENGKEGAEVLADAINKVFTPAIDKIYEHKGFVSSFAGDAFTAIFPYDAADAVDSLAAASGIQKLFQEGSILRTRFGSFNLSIKIGMSSGPVTWKIISHVTQNAFHFGGKAIRRCIEGERIAIRNEVIFDADILSHAANCSDIMYHRRQDGFYSLQFASAPIYKDFETHIPTSRSKFIPKTILSMTGRGEFRDIVSCFISFDEERDFATGVESVITLAHSYGGYFNKTGFSHDGGMMLVLFGAPVNQGNLYNRSLDFALAVMKIPRLSARIGLTCGTAFTGFVGSKLRGEYTALGSVVNLSARFIEKKKRVVTYLDQSICRQACSHYRIQELKPRRFKGFKGMIPIGRLIEKKKASHGSFYEGVIVGRQTELNLLSKLLQPVKHGEFGGIIYIYGNPGVGKSRLAYEIIRRHGIRTFTLQADSILKKPLNPFVYFFNKFFLQNGEYSSGNSKARFRKEYRHLINRVKSLPDCEKKRDVLKELCRIESIIASIIGIFWNESVYDMIAPKDRAVVTQRAIKEFFIACSLLEPIVLVVEDIQWIDNESQKAFEILTRRIDGYPVAVMACSRFDDDGRRPELKADEDVSRHVITLKQLSGNSERKLIEDRLGNKIDNELAVYIQTRTEGNPYYTEQFCLYLRENSIIEIRKGQYCLIREPADIPADISMILVSRIDRLSAGLKETVQIASVLGREFEVRVLSTLIELLSTTKADESPVLRNCDIDQLISSGEEKLIWSALTALRYLFSHALLRDSAYDMQLRARLRNLHRLAGDAIVKLFPDNRAFYADCAHHYEQAENWSKAQEYNWEAGKFFFESARYDESDAYLKKALSICQKTLGEKHQSTAQIYDTIGMLLLRTGLCDAALVNHEKALAIREELFGENHSAMAESFNNIGIVHLYKGDFDTALAYHEKAIAIRTELFGKKHPDTAVLYNSIGRVYYHKGNYDTALAYHEKALAIRRELLGEKHLHTALSYSNMATAYSGKGDFDKALEYHRKVLAIRKELLGENHPDTAQSYNNIGALYWQQGNQDKVLKYYEKARSIWTESLGEKHPDMAALYNNIGGLYWRGGDCDMALTYLNKALVIWEELLGEKHLNTAKSYNNIGSVYNRKGNYGRALVYYEKALAVRKLIVGEKHPHTARSFVSIASVYVAQERFRDAEEMFIQSLTIMNDSLRENHPDTISCLKSLSALYVKMGNAVAADRIEEQLLKLGGTK
ncbi:MAG: tetratricopeptide repeat protein [Candidatus Sabulitectum sp.]|nr:tetratricopeptide repeat protein [Candidatus Sabulitectum sp.]